MGTIRSIGGNGRDTGAESFEQNFQNLQEVVRKLSEGNLTLQDALSAFEEGMALADRCGAMLEEAELRVKQVSERAMRAGNASAREAAAGLTAVDLDEPELLGFEIETYESVIFEPLERKGTGRASSTGQASQPGGKKDTGTGKSRPPAPKPPSILDPLFDEDD